MSLLPSALKSPVDSTFQAAPGFVASAPLVESLVPPSISQMVIAPVEAFCQTMSALPSPLKSPVQFVEAPVAVGP